MAVTSGSPALQLSSRTLGFFSSMFFFVTLCSIEDWVTVDTRGSHQLAGSLPCAALWLLKIGIRHFTRSGTNSNLTAFDVGVSTFGPLSLNFVNVAHAVSRARGELICFLEVLFGIALGNTELASVGTAFLVPLTLVDIAEVSENLPLFAFVLSSSAICASSLLFQEKNREKFAERVQAVLFLSSEQQSLSPS